MEPGKAFAHDGGRPFGDLDDAAVFHATIRPHRSLGSKGFRILMAVCAVVAGSAAVRAVAFGFWPVGAFLILDLAALYVAFRVSYGRARAFEEVVLTPIELLIRRVTHRGEQRDWRLNPLWTRLVRETDAEYGLERLSLVSRGEHIAIARELSPAEREDFADAFGRALADVKRGI